MTIFYPRTGPDAYTLPAPAPVTPCPVCERRAAYGRGVCDSHSVDPWAGAR